MPTTSFPYILAIGDSLTAGYGLPAAAAFPAQLQTRLRAVFPDAAVQNAGVSGDTTEGGLRRLPRLLASLTRKPDLAIVELGANDLLRGIAAERTRANLDAMLEQLGACAIATLLASFEVPRFLGALATQYDGMYAALAAKHDAALAPFFPAGVLGHADMVLADRLHPNARAIELVAAGFAPAVLRTLESAKAEAA